MIAVDGALSEDCSWKGGRILESDVKKVFHEPVWQ